MLFALTLGGDTASWLVKNINELIGMQPQVQDFFNDHYCPEIAALIPKRRFSVIDAVDVWISFLGMMIKILWAFLWQEYFIPLPNEAFYSKPFMTLVRAITPNINAFAAKLERFYNTEADVVFGTELYPGARHCNTHSPHALWHQ